jgi:hypothetical protein
MFLLFRDMKTFQFHGLPNTNLLLLNIYISQVQIINAIHFFVEVTQIVSDVFFAQEVFLSLFLNKGNVSLTK